MIRKTPILVVVSDRELRDELVSQLNAQGDLRAHGVDVGDAAAAVQDERYGVIVLDLCAETEGAITALRESGAPLLLLAGPGQADAAAATEETLAKPFRFSVLLARIRTHIRSRDGGDEIPVAIGPYEFRPAAKALLRGEDMRVRLTEKEASILSYLLRAGDKPVARDELLREVWGYNSGVTTHTLETHIYRLRQKIEPDAETPSILITETGGYRLQP